MNCGKWTIALGLSWILSSTASGQVTGEEKKPASTDKPTTTQPRPDMTAVVTPDSRIQKDIGYVPNAAPQQRLDVYAPANAKGAPVVLFIHGGEWTKGDKSEVSFKPKFLNENGIVFISVNYRLSGTAKHPAQVEDVAAAVRWARDHVSEFGGDANKMVLMGHSAGCHLVTLAGLDSRPLAKQKLKPSDLKGVVSWSGGAFDLVQKVKDGGMYADYIRINFGPREEAWRDASPMNHVGEARPMPKFLFVSADGDKPPSKAASDRMVTMIRDIGGQAQRAILPGKTHMTANHELGMPGDKSGDVLLRFVREATSPASAPQPNT